MLTKFSFTLGFSLLLSSLASSSMAQPTNNPGTAPPATTLNLDTDNVSRQISKEYPPAATDELPSLSNGSADKINELFKKAEKRHSGGQFKEEEISTPGAPERVTKVTTSDGISYCVYNPSAGSATALDGIRHGLQSQVRSCP